MLHQGTWALSHFSFYLIILITGRLPRPLAAAGAHSGPPGLSIDVVRGGAIQQGKLRKPLLSVDAEDLNNTPIAEVMREHKLRDVKHPFASVSRRHGRKQAPRRRFGSRSALQASILAAIVTPALGVAAYVLVSSYSLEDGAASELVGRASVIDGDTIEIHGQSIRLQGIDAPESDQLCTTSGTRYRCGQKAALALSELIGNRTVSCVRTGTDRYGRIVATCSAGGQDLGAWLVEHGQALAYRRYSNAYITEEAAASAARLGIWAGDFDPPWEWRQRYR